MAYTDPTTGLDVIRKQPSESLLLDLPLADVMRSGDTIASVTSVTAAVVAPGTGTVTVSGATFSGSTVQARFASGTAGENYKVTAKATTTGGDTVEADAMLYVRD